MQVWSSRTESSL